MVSITNQIKVRRFADLASANGVLEAPEQLHAQVTSEVSRAGGNTLVLKGTPVQVTETLGQAAPGEVLVDAGRDGVGGGLRALGGLAALLEEVAADVVGHALELAELELDAGLSGEDALAVGAEGALDALGVVGGEEEEGLGVLRDAGALGDLHVDEVAGDLVEALVGVLGGVVDHVAGVRADVGAADELDAQRPALLGGELDVAGDVLGRGLEVGLDGVGDDDLAVAVVLAHEVDGPVVDSVLHLDVLGVEPGADALLGGLLTDGGDGFVDGFRHGLLVHERISCHGTSPGESENSC